MRGLIMLTRLSMARAWTRPCASLLIVVISAMALAWLVPYIMERYGSLQLQWVYAGQGF